MERQDYINQITTLKNAIEQLKETNASLRNAMEYLGKRHENQACILHKITSGLTDKIRSLRGEFSKQTDYNKRHNKMSFGKKNLSSRTKQDDKRSREEAKMEHDGSGTSTNTDSDKSEKEKSENPSDD